MPEVLVTGATGTTGSRVADLDISAGAEDRVTDTVLRVTGRAPRSFRRFVETDVS